MAKQGEAWIVSGQKRALELALIGPMLPAAGGLLVANALGQVTHEVERSLYPGNRFTSAKIGDPEKDSFMLRWLRRAMIDELPQVGDVRRGSMALIGPRADEPEHINQLFDAIDDPDLHDQWKEVRFAQRPGIISSYAVHSHRHNLEGVTERSRFSEEEALAMNARQRATLDIADFEAASLAHDLRLVAATAGMAVSNYTHYVHQLLTPGTQTAEI